MAALAPQRDPNLREVLDPGDPRWPRLRDLIRAYSLKTGDFTLSSGRKSNYLFQLRQTAMLPEGAAIISGVFLDYMIRHEIRAIGGLELGAVPLVAAVAVASQFRNSPVDAFFVRKAPKTHGACEAIDGHLPDGEALIVDDVATSGGSLLKAVEGMIKENPKSFAKRALVVVDREEGAFENLAERGIHLDAIFKKSDFS